MPKKQAASNMYVNSGSNAVNSQAALNTQGNGNNI